MGRQTAVGLIDVSDNGTVLGMGEKTAATANDSAALHNASSENLVIPGTSLKTAEGLMYTRILVPVIFGIVVLAGLAGNSLVAYVIVSRHKMRHVWNLLLLNLAIADIALLAICGTFTTVFYVTVDWPFGDVFCRIMQYFVYVTCYVSVLTLVTVSAMRYYITLRGAVGQFVSSQRNIVILMVAIWLLCLTSQLPVAWILGVRDVRYEAFNLTVTECVFADYERGPALTLSFFTLAYVVPFVIISVVYLLLVLHLRNRPMPGVEKKSEKRTQHVARVVTSVIVAFGICWLPIHIHMILGSYKLLPPLEDYFIFPIIWTALVFLNSALNPLLYNLLSTEFRDSFRSVLCRHRQDAGGGPRYSSGKSKSTGSTSAGDD